MRPPLPSVHCSNNSLSPHSLFERSELEWGVKEKKRDSFFSENLRLSYKTRIAAARLGNDTLSNTRTACKSRLFANRKGLEKKKLTRFFFLQTHSNSLRSNMEWELGAPALRADALQPVGLWVATRSRRCSGQPGSSPNNSPPPTQGCAKLPTVCPLQ